MKAGGERLSSVKLTQDFVRVPSHAAAGEAQLVGLQEQVTAEHLPHGFTTQKLETATSGRPTLLIANTEFPSIVLIAHNDTVNPWQQKQGAEFGQGKYHPFSGDIITEDGKEMVVGRGALDDKSGAATAMSALAEYKGREHELPGVMVVLTSDEEGHFAGMQAVAEHFEGLRKIDPDYQPAFVLSLNGNGREMSTGCRGVTEIDLTVHGRTGHAAIRKPGAPLPINALEEGVGLVSDLRRTLRDLPPTELGRPTVNNAGGQAGTTNHEGDIKVVPNMVPDTFTALVESRLNDGEFPDGRVVNAESIAQTMHELAADRGVTVETSTVMERAAWNSRKEDATFLKEIIKRVTGENEVKDWVIGEHGYDEIGLFMEVANAGGDRQRPVPGAIWGLGDSAGFHAPDEAMGTQELKDQAEVVREILAAPDFKRRTHFTPRAN